MDPVERQLLLIDDDAAYRHICKQFLRSDTQVRYNVVEADNGERAISECLAKEFDCLLVDYTLPDRKGTDVIRELARTLDNAMPPAIILTADGGEEAAAEAVRAEASDFLAKRNISTKSLSRSIGNVIEKGTLQRSISQRTTELEHANQELTAKNNEIQRFYQNVSHEVKTPLAAIREFIAIVLDGLVGPVTNEQQELLAHAVDSCDQIAGHFNDLIEMTRLEAKKITMNKKLTSLGALATRCFASTTAALREKELRFTHDIDPSIPLMDLDRNRIIQVISNLLGNAIKYTDPGGVVGLTIRYYADRGNVEIRVSDSGCGIAEEDLPHVFDRLYQVGNDNNEFTGMGLGLGLSIAKEIVLLHFGEIFAESKIGEGSTFTVRLPLEDRTSSEMLH